MTFIVSKNGQPIVSFSTSTVVESMELYIFIDFRSISWFTVARAKMLDIKHVKGYAIVFLPFILKCTIQKCTVGVESIKKLPEAISHCQTTSFKAMFGMEIIFLLLMLCTRIQIFLDGTNTWLTNNIPAQWFSTVSEMWRAFTLEKDLDTSSFCYIQTIT